MIWVVIGSNKDPSVVCSSHLPSVSLQGFKPLLESGHLSCGPGCGGLPASVLFIGATFLAGLVAKVPGSGWSGGARPAVLAAAPRIVGVPEAAVE